VINTYGYVIYVHRKDHICQVLSFFHQLNVCPFIIFFYTDTPTVLSLSLSSTRKLTYVFACCSFLCIARVNQLFYTIRLILIWSTIKKEKKEKKENAYIVLINICCSHNNNSEFKFLRVCCFVFFFYCFYRKTGTTMSL
jgi:hypothetical protein